MLQHDITNDKYYLDGVEIAKEEYDDLYAEWERNRPAPAPPDPDPEIDDAELLEILMGGAE